MSGWVVRFIGSALQNQERKGYALTAACGSKKERLRTYSCMRQQDAIAMHARLHEEERGAREMRVTHRRTSGGERKGSARRWSER